MKGSYIILLILMTVAMAITLSLIAISIDILLNGSSRSLLSIEPESVINDLITGKIADSIADELKDLYKVYNFE